MRSRETGKKQQHARTTNCALRTKPREMTRHPADDFEFVVRTRRGENGFRASVLVREKGPRSELLRTIHAHGGEIEIARQGGSIIIIIVVVGLSDRPQGAFGTIIHHGPRVSDLKTTGVAQIHLLGRLSLRVRVRYGPINIRRRTCQLLGRPGRRDGRWQRVVRDTRETTCHPAETIGPAIGWYTRARLDA